MAGPLHAAVKRGLRMAVLVLRRARVRVGAAREEQPRGLDLAFFEARRELADSRVTEIDERRALTRAAAGMDELGRRADHSCERVDICEQRGDVDVARVEL